MGATPQMVDFTNVRESSGFNRNRIPSGDYAAIITKVENAKAKDGVPQFLFSIKIRSKGTSVFPYYCKLQENQLWKLRNIFIAAGKTVPKKKVKVDPNQIVGKLIGITVEDDDYDGKELSQIAAVFPAADLDDSSVAPVEDDDDEMEEADDDTDLGDVTADDEEEADDEEAEPEAEGQDLSGLSRNELKARLRELQPDIQVRKSQSDDDLRELLQGMLSSGETEDEEDEPAPAPKAKAARKPKLKTDDLTDDDLDSIDIDDL